MNILKLKMTLEVYLDYKMKTWWSQILAVLGIALAIFVNFYLSAWWTSFKYEWFTG